MTRPQPESASAPSILSEKSRTPEMFTAIARRYDLLNHVLSFNADRRWRAALVEAAGVRDGERVLDAATGTADVAIAFARRTRAGEITGVDLSEGMLAVAREKLERRGLARRVRLMEGDVLALPFDDATFDVVSIAFGLRNLPDYGRGVREMARVLKPGGRLVVLEFAPPRGSMLAAYRLYLDTWLPVMGRALSGSGEAYRYLAASIDQFIAPEELAAMVLDGGLCDVRVRRLSGGIAQLVRGAKDVARPA